jgi:hypothetical protein
MLKHTVGRADNREKAEKKYMFEEEISISKKV